jgi:hypothetical protein
MSKLAFLSVKNNFALAMKPSVPLTAQQHIFTVGEIVFVLLLQ